MNDDNTAAYAAVAVALVCATLWASTTLFKPTVIAGNLILRPTPKAGNFAITMNEFYNRLAVTVLPLSTNSAPHFTLKKPDFVQVSLSSPLLSYDRLTCPAPIIKATKTAPGLLGVVVQPFVSSQTQSGLTWSDIKSTTTPAVFQRLSLPSDPSLTPTLLIWFTIALIVVALITFYLRWKTSASRTQRESTICTSDKASRGAAKLSLSPVFTTYTAEPACPNKEVKSSTSNSGYQHSIPSEKTNNVEGLITDHKLLESLHPNQSKAPSPSQLVLSDLSVSSPEVRSTTDVVGGPPLSKNLPIIDDANKSLESIESNQLKTISPLQPVQTFLTVEEASEIRSQHLSEHDHEHSENNNLLEDSPYGGLKVTSEGLTSSRWAPGLNHTIGGLKPSQTALDPNDTKEDLKGSRCATATDSTTATRFFTAALAHPGLQASQWATEKDDAYGTSSHIARSSHAGPSIASPSNAGPSNAGPSNAGPSNAGPSNAGPSNAGPSTAGTFTAGPSTAGPSTAASSIASPSIAVHAAADAGLPSAGLPTADSTSAGPSTESSSTAVPAQTTCAWYLQGNCRFRNGRCRNGPHIFSGYPPVCYQFRNGKCQVPPSECQYLHPAQTGRLRTVCVKYMNGHCHKVPRFCQYDHPTLNPPPRCALFWKHGWCSRQRDGMYCNYSHTQTQHRQPHLSR